MWEMILSIVFAVLSAVLACVTYYLDVKKKIVEAVNGEIANAEELEKIGAEKMAHVVAQLKAIVPVTLKFIFTDKVIETIAQKAFDTLEEYAQKQADKKRAEAEADKAKNAAV